MSITITLYDLGVFIVFCVIVTAGIFITLTLHNMNKLTKNLNNFFEKNEQSINESINSMPTLIDNSNKTVLSLKEGIDNTKSTISDVEEAIADVVVTVSDKADNMGIYLNTFSDIIKILINSFSKSK